MMATSTNKDSPNILHLIGKGTVGAEIGVWKGNSAVNYVKKELAELHLVDPYSVEPYRDNSEMPFDQYIAKYSKVTGEFTEAGFKRYYDNVYNSVVEKFKNHPEVKVHRMTSGQWFEANKDLKLDWIYIDGDHSYEGCLFDLENALPMMKKGGYILGDDYYWPGAKWGKKGVTEALDTFIAMTGLNKSRFGETQFAIKV